MDKGIIYYTDFNVQEPIFKACQKRIKNNFKGDIMTVSLNRPLLNFDNNVVLEGERGYPMLISQILIALRLSVADYVFFTEHDVLYPPSHFDFVPPRDDIFYYNENVWRWVYGSDKVVRYQRMLPLSCLCVNRKFALEHYKIRQEAIDNAHPDAFNSRDPELARKWGYEPGTKKKKRGGLTDDDFETWKSEHPVIDIRHKDSYSPEKATLDSFKHTPLQWKEISIGKLPYWDLKEIFEL